MDDLIKSSSWIILYLLSGIQGMVSGAIVGGIYGIVYTIKNDNDKWGESKFESYLMKIIAGGLMGGYYGGIFGGGAAELLGIITLVASDAIYGAINIAVGAIFGLLGSRKFLKTIIDK